MIAPKEEVFVNNLKITTTLAIVPDSWGGESCGIQSFPHVLRTWVGALQNWMGERGFNQYMREPWRA